jgi:hypothetical protein
LPQTSARLAQNHEVCKAGTETKKLWDMFGPSLRPDQALRLFRLALEADDDDDTALDLEAWCGVPSDGDIVGTLPSSQQEWSDPEEAMRAQAPC